MSRIENTSANQVYSNLDTKASLDKSSAALGQDDFLELLITQMSYQDPINPSDPGDFLGQLAQFGTVDGIGQLNESMAALNTGLQSNQALQASSLVGRNVQLSSSEAVLSEQDGLNGAVVIPQDARNVKLTIKNDSGEVIKQMSLGNNEAGTQDFKWNGIGDDGRSYMPGTYQVSAQGDVFGDSVALETLATVNVNSVTLGREGSDVALNVEGLGSRSLDEVWNIS